MHIITGTCAAVTAGRSWLFPIEESVVEWHKPRGEVWLLNQARLICLQLQREKKKKKTSRTATFPRETVAWSNLKKQILEWIIDGIGSP